MREIEEIEGDLRVFAEDLREMFGRNREIALKPRPYGVWEEEMQIKASRACAEIFDVLLEYKEHLSKEAQRCEEGAE